MSDNKTSEMRFLPIIGLCMLFPFLRMFGGEMANGAPFTALESAFLIPLIPIVIFPVIAILGQVNHGDEAWRERFKEGGMIALCSLAITLSLTIWLAIEFFTNGASFEEPLRQSVFNWINFDTITQDAAGNWIHLQNDSLGVGLWIDNVSMMLLFVASFLCFLICWFSIGYMNTDPINKDRNHRFYAEFVLFTAGMLGMVLADSFLWLFIFWEIMGLCSYLLIGFYYERPSAAYAAKKAFLTTRVGDIFLLIGLLMMYDIYGSLEFAVIFDDPSLHGAVDTGMLRCALIMLFIGAVGKSAQFPLHVWLPDAMEGPTPVSALIHAATMVNAGLYLVARFVPFFDVTSHGHGVEGLGDVAILIAWVGGITAFMAAIIAFVQNDIKKVLAYSTMSQLAYIFTGLGVALWFYNHGEHHAAVIAFGASMFHLFNHAMAKGMLFMASGSVIHEMHHAHHDAHHDDHGDEFDAQDMRNMGGLASKLPITSTAMAIGSASIIGIPLIGGFWSKEGIVAETWNAAALHGGTWLLVPAFLILLTAGMTGFYMTRMWMMTFAGKPKTEYAENVHEQTPWIPTPLITLSIISLLGGFVLAVLGATHWLGEAEALGTAIHEHGMVVAILDAIVHAFLPTEMFLFLITWVAITISLVVGPAMAMRIHGGRLNSGETAPRLISWILPLSSKFGRVNVDDLANSGLADALHRRLYFDELYEWVIAKTVIPLAHALSWFDKNVVDGAIKGIEFGTQKISRDVRNLTTGSASDYIMVAVIGTFSILVLLWGVI